MKIVNYLPCCLASVLVFSFLACNSIKNQLQDSSENNYQVHEPYLVILSMDGFRWDYPQMYHTPNLDSLAKIGVKAHSLIPSFPSKTFPNHYTIATGLYPEHHGIVLNTFTDPEIGDYKLSDRKAIQNAEFYLGEPIWVTAEKQMMRTACFYWPGSEAPIQGIYPDIWKRYDDKVSFESRIDTVVSWLALPAAKRPHLVMWYFDQPDHVGHDKGPFAGETRQTVEHLDSLIGIFCKKINQLGIADSVDLVFTSDHGMGAITAERSIFLENYLQPEWVEFIRGGNPVIMLKPAENYTDTVWTVLKSIPHMKVYSKNDMPAEFHYTDSKRILDYVCIADSSYALYWKASPFTNGGTHGYDPANTDMHAIFYASGPAFKKGFESGDFQNIHLYALFAKILGLKAAKTDGDLKQVEDLLALPSTE